MNRTDGRKALGSLHFTWVHRVEANLDVTDNELLSIHSLHIKVQRSLHFCLMRLA